MDARGACPLPPLLLPSALPQSLKPGPADCYPTANATAPPSRRLAAPHCLVPSPSQHAQKSMRSCPSASVRAALASETRRSNRTGSSPCRAGQAGRAKSGNR
jgi:hypothetical protein